MKSETKRPLTAATHLEEAAKLKVVVQWLSHPESFRDCASIKVYLRCCFAVCLVDSEVLRNRQLLVAEKRWVSLKSTQSNYKKSVI